MSKFVWFIIALVALVAGIIVYNKVLHGKDNKPAAAKGGPPKEMSVNAYVVSPKSIENSILASGTLLPFEDAELHPEVSGKITQLNLNEGTQVAKGTLLVKLYDADLQAQLKKLKLQKEQAQKTESRIKQLLAINGVGQQEYDDVVTNINNIEADMDLVQAQITKTEIRAPFNGVVGLKNVSLGSYVTPTTLVATFQQIDPLKVDFTIPEKYAASTGKGETLKFDVEGFTEKFSGKIYAVEPQIDVATRSIKVRAQVQNTKAKLLPGAFAKVDLGLKNIDNAILVPTQCIIPEARNKKVIVVNNGKADFRVVETGVRGETYIQVTKGLEVGDTIVTTALMYIKPDMGLKVVKISDK